MAGQTFDLTECSQRFYANTRSIRIEFVVGAFVLAATGAGILVYQFAHGSVASSFRAIYGIEYFLPFAGAIYLGWGSTKFAPGAKLLDIGSEGAVFDFPRGGRTVLRWNDTHFVINLEDARTSPYGQKYGFAGFARIPKRPSSQLTSEAMDALVAAAKAHGLTVSVRERGGRWSFAGPLHEWIEIRSAQSRRAGQE